MRFFLSVFGGTFTKCKKCCGAILENKMLVKKMKNNIENFMGTFLI
jgi:hypothetical protein